ncbi:MBOAT family O-acyltransferase [uncultured Gelidibacter sp.]|uniref:MBOAT family O-acyltransferase n=1 Tax=uncultured Gelidibacter sp. TaxID=259318 RepID=UPI00260C27ED|nr:MBOAT family O-acyltransferase [uncultured Gelidibacter sp.]
MLFNSFEFLIFLVIVFGLYWGVFRKNIPYQNLLLLLGSYLFYGWWDWRFLSLIILSSGLDFILGLKIDEAETQKKKKLFLTISLMSNFGLLAVLKYFNFFSVSLYHAFESIGYKIDPFTLNVVLPVGISFYTFQTVSYSIDIYRSQLKPTKNVVAFFAFVSFFPQLVAGPIERASNLLPQFTSKRKFNYDKAVDGMRQILWGLFKKIVIADNCALVVNEIFGNYQDQSGSVLLLGAFYFALQIYGDFSGYSDIAIGTAKLFGFNLMTNFKTPYFSRDIAEFWRRWHISLSTWFRDYLYIPLGGSRVNTMLAVRNVFIIFIVSGFWHGANWTFIVWGALNALYFIPLLLSGANRKNTNVVAENRLLPSIKEFFQMSLTFTLVCMAWVFFRAPSISIALDYFGRMFANSFLPENFYYFKPQLIFLIVVFIVFEWFLFRYDDYLLRFSKLPPILRRSFYVCIGFIMYLFMVNESTTFIYFQF